MVVGTLVVVVDASFEFQVGDPAAVEEPDQLEVRGQQVVPLFGELIGEGVGVRGGVHAADIAAQAGFQPQLLAEGAGIVQGETPAGVGGVGRGELAGGAGPFGSQVHDAFPQFEALGNGNLVGAGVGRKDYVERRTAFLGMDLHQTAAQVSVFGRRDAGNHFHGFDVLYREAAGANTGQGAKAGVVPHADAVDFHARGKSGIAHGGTAGAQGESVVGGEVGVEGLSAGQEGRDAAHAVHLEMVQGGSAYGLGGVDVVFGGFGGDHYLLQRQGTQGELNGETFYIITDVQFFLVGDITQAGDLQLVGAGLNAAQGKRSVLSGDSPEVVLVQAHHGANHGIFAAGFHYLAREPDRCGQGGEGQEDQKE